MEADDQVKESKFKSIVGFIVGLVFCIIGVTLVIPRTQTLGIVWTLFAILLTITQGVNAFTEHGISQPIKVRRRRRRVRKNADEVELVCSQSDDPAYEEFEEYVEFEFDQQDEKTKELEDRLITLKEWYEKQLITQHEYELKKEEILKSL